jgi:hypothetical protein
VGADDVYALCWAILIGGFLIWRRPIAEERRPMEAIWDSVLIMIAVTILVLEAYAKLTGAPTLSQMIWRWSRIYPLLPIWIAVVFNLVIIHWWRGGQD